MPAVQPPASKLLAQKWQEEKFRVHRQRVRNAPSLLDMAAPRTYPHLKLAVNKVAMQEERQAKYDRENQMLLKKINIIIKGHGTVDNWNSYIKKDLHTAARNKQQREIEWQNMQMLKRIRNAKPVIQRKKQEADFAKHKQHQELINATSKDYMSPRIAKANTENAPSSDRSERSPNMSRDESEKSDKDEAGETTVENTEENVDQPTETEKDSPRLPRGKKKTKKQRSPLENSKKNRTAAVPKLPKI